MTEIEVFRQGLLNEGKCERTVRGYVSDVAQFLEYSSENDGDHVALAPIWLNESKDSCGSATIARRLCSLKAYFRICHDSEPLGRYKSPPVPTGSAHPLPNGMHDVRKMLASTKPRSDVRMAIGLMAFAGLRVTEAREIRWEHIKPEWLIIHGKGGKVRRVPIAPELQVIIDQHHSPSRVGDPLVDMTDRGIRYAVSRAAVKAGLARPVSSHDLRMTFGSVVYDITKDLRVTQELLGHASPQTTALYTGISEATKQLAVAAALP